MIKRKVSVVIVFLITATFVSTGFSPEWIIENVKSSKITNSVDSDSTANYYKTQDTIFASSDEEWNNIKSDENIRERTKLNDEISNTPKNRSGQVNSGLSRNNFSNLAIYTSTGQIENIPIPYSEAMFSYITVGNKTTIFVNDGRGGDKIDISLRDYTTLYKEDYLKDWRIRIIVLPGYELQKGTYIIASEFSKVELAYREVCRNIPCVGGSIVKTYKTLPFIVVDIPYQNISSLAEDKYVAHIFLDKKYHVSLSESVPIIKPLEEWSQLENYFGYEINGSGIKIAVLDTGIDKTHPDLDDLDDNSSTYDPKVIAEKCFTEEDHTWDGFGHGTHCASIAAGTGEASNYTYVGVAPQAYLVNGKVLTDGGSGSESWIIDGIEWAVNEQNADVISMSLGSNTNGDGTDPMSMAIDWATDQGVICALAAGNNGYGNMFTVGTPAVSRKAITVGATTKTDEVIYFSSLGPTSDYRLKPDVCAPGVNIVAARANGTSMGGVMDDYYVTASGTSMATPHVAGAAALILQAHPNWNPVMIKSSLMGNAKILSNEHLWEQGAGRIALCNSTNTTLLIIEPSSSFGILDLGGTVTANLSLTNLADTPAIVNISAYTLCDWIENNYVNTNLSSVIVPANSNISISLIVGPIDMAAPEGWYEGWLNITSQNCIRAPYFFGALSSITISIVDVDNSTHIEGIVALLNYPDVSFVNTIFISAYESVGPWPYGTFFTKSGNYSLCAQCGWICNESLFTDRTRTFMLEKKVTLSKFSKLNVTLSLAEANVSKISLPSSNGANLTTHGYIQFFNGQPYYDSFWNTTLMNWGMGGGWSGVDLKVSNFTLYTSVYDPPENLSECIGYYASDEILSEVYLLNWKYWNVSSIPSEIKCNQSELAKYDFHYDMPETYPRDNLSAMTGFWLTWEYMSGFQGWGSDFLQVFAGTNATYYLSPETATYWGYYAMDYGLFGLEELGDSFKGPLEYWTVGRSYPPPQLAPEKGETGTRVLGDYQFAPYIPGLSINYTNQASFYNVTLSGNIWSNLRSTYDSMNDLSEWTVVSGSWNEESDQYGWYGCTIISGESNASEEGLAYAGDENWSDYNLYTSVKVLNGTSASIRFRVSDAGFYQLTINPENDTIELYRYDGNYSLITTTNMTIEYNTWYLVEIITKGSWIKCTFDSKTVISLDNADLINGKIGLRVYGSHTHFLVWWLWRGWWPHLQWYRTSEQAGLVSPYRQDVKSEYYLYIDDTLIANGTLGRIDIDESLGIWWDNLNLSWNVNGTRALLSLIMPNLATLCQWTTYNISFNLTGNNMTIPPLFNIISMPLSYSANETISIRLECPDTISNLSLMYSFNNGTTWNAANSSPNGYIIQCQPKDGLGIFISATDLYGNSYQYISSPMALCRDVILDVPEKATVAEGKTATISGRLTTVEGVGLPYTAVSLHDGNESYINGTTVNGTFSFDYIASFPDNVTQKTICITSPSAGLFAGNERYITIHRTYENSTICGYVNDTLGLPVEGAYICAYNESINYNSRTITNETGYYKIDTICGNLSIHSYKEGYSDYYEWRDVLEHEIIWLNITLEQYLHEPIYIAGNDDFTLQNGVKRGNGTQDNPYIIENWEINASTVSYPCEGGIHIENTDAYFIIRNCVIRYGYEPDVRWDYGIYFYNVTNGKIENVTSYNNYYGIYLSYSSNNKLRNNILENNTYNFGVSGEYISDYYQDIDTSNTINGKPICYIIEKNDLVFNETMSIGYLGLISCSNVTVKNLTLTDNYQGLLLVNTSYSTITNCNVYNNEHGIELYDSSNNNITNCNAYNNYYGIELDYSSNNIITNCYVYDNSGCGIGLGSSSNNQITNCNVYNNSHGIYIAYSSNNNITNCDVYNNSCGIYLRYSSSNTITNCYVYNNSYGIVLDYSSNNNITNCDVYNNSNYGIIMYYSSNNQIHYCNIYSNTLYGIYNYNTESQYQVNATYNWWGSANGPGMDGANGVYGAVLYDPWFTSADKTYLYHAPIYIDGNSQFTSENGVTGGSGTEVDPYIIENWDINASGANGIDIRNTDVYFIIRNCVIHDGKNNNYYGIYFYNVINGKIDNVTSYNNSYGIYLDWYSSNNNITNCAVYNNSDYGIILSYSSNNNTITNCTVYNNYNGIVLYSSSNNTITNCNVYNNEHGIELYDSSNNNITNCNAYNNYYGIELDYSSNNTITNCNVYNNEHGIELYDSSNNNITNCNAYNNYYGIYIAYSSNNNQITNCDAYNNYYDGILLSDSSNNITNCNVYNNSCGIYLNYSSNNEIRYCNIYNNTNYGVYNYNTESQYQANAICNWWGDTSGPYHPSTNPSGKGDNVTDNVIYEPWLAESYHPPLITINQPVDGLITNKNVTLIYTIDVPLSSTGEAIPVNIDGPDSGTNYTNEGVYNITIIITDDVDSTSIATVSFTIDKTAPTITVEGIADGAFYNGSVTPIIDVTDPNLNAGQITLNGTAFVSGTTITEEANYVLFIQATDEANNVAIKIVSFTIDKTLPEITIDGIIDGVYYNNSVTPVIEFNDTNLNVTTITLNGVPFDSGTTITGETDYVLVAYASDKAGNTAQRIVSFTIDKTKPILEILTPANNTITNQNIVLTYSVSDNMDDRGNITVNILNGTVYSDEKSYIVMVNATDRAGNTAIQIITFIVDKTKPVIAVSGVADNAYYNISITPVIDMTDLNLNTTLVELNDASFTSGTEVINEGDYVLFVLATDKAGNNVSETISFTIDKTSPTITIAESSQTTSKSSFTMHWSTNATDIQYFEISTDGSQWANVGTNMSYTFTNLSEGTNVLYVRGTDLANNTGPSSSITVIAKISEGITPGKEAVPTNWILYIGLLATVIIIIVAVAVIARLRKKQQ